MFDTTIKNCLMILLYKKDGFAAVQLQRSAVQLQLSEV
jgi:hypothetical protein